LIDSELQALGEVWVVLVVVVVQLGVAEAFHARRRRKCPVGGLH